MDGQMLTVTLAIILALGYISRSIYQSLSGHASGCGSGCGGCPSAKVAPAVNEANRNRIALPQV